MGDKDQTKWSRSYSLKYSHDESLVDGSGAVEVFMTKTNVDLWAVVFV